MIHSGPLVNYVHPQWMNIDPGWTSLSPGNIDYILDFERFDVVKKSKFYSLL